MIAVVAWRGGRGAKSRLASVMSPDARADLADHMLACVLTALSEARSIDRVCVVSPKRPPYMSADWIGDGEHGLNAAFMLVLAEIGAEPVLLLPADLPMLRGKTIDALVGMHDRHEVVIAPDRRGNGTNALLLDHPNRMAPAFGLASFDRHCAVARATGARLGVFEADDLAFDVDLPEDLIAFQQVGRVHQYA